MGLKMATMSQATPEKTETSVATTSDPKQIQGAKAAPLRPCCVCKETREVWCYYKPVKNS
jgi:hypothetical protein